MIMCRSVTRVLFQLVQLEIMKVLVVFVVLVYNSAGISGFLFDTDPPVTTGSIRATTAPDGCSIEVFTSCTDALWSAVEIKGDNVNIDNDAILKFYCGPNATQAIQCIKDRINPNCGPDTDAAMMKKIISNVPANYSYDSMCNNSTETNELLRCQKLLPNLKGFRDCVTGDTLNKTMDPTDTCNYFESTLGCSFKYTDLMCPSSIHVFKEAAGDSPGCTLNFEASQEARSCDKDMQKACEASFNPPSYSNTSALVDFVCSGRSQEYSQCVMKVYSMCENKLGVNATQIKNNVEFFQNQTSISCTGGNGTNTLAECTAKFSTIQGFQHCITGVTLNKTVDPTDVCKFFQSTAGCTNKYINLMCPEELDALQKTAQMPPTCSGNTNATAEAVSCDANMTEACTAAYNPPLVKATSTGETYYDFVCSGRAAGYVECVEKVNRFCTHPKADATSILYSVQYNHNQTTVMCSDKKGYIAFTDCSLKYVESEEFKKCVNGVSTSDNCSLIKAGIKCNVDVIMKACPSSYAFYKSAMYTSNAVKLCNATSVLDVPLITASSSYKASLSGWALAIFVTYVLQIILFF